MWYMTETKTMNSLSKPEPLRAKTLAAAKREAEAKQLFLTDVVAIGQKLDPLGLILNEIEWMRISGTWVPVTTEC